MLMRLLKFLLVLALLFFAYRFARQQGLVKGAWFDQLDDKVTNINPWQEKAPELNMDLEKLGNDGLNQVQILASQAKDAGSVAQEFVQEVVKVDENKDKNLSEKAFEYGRYIYCQEVVKQYEELEKQSF
jgi:hypothetical protein